VNLIQRFDRNLIGRDFVVGDIHGFLDELNQKMISINFNADTDRLFSVGDLVDRGPRSKDVLILLSKPWFYAIRGNHEQMAIGRARFPELYDDYTYTANGGGWFLVLPKGDQLKYADAFDKLPYVFEIDTPNGIVGIVHAQCKQDDWNVFKENIDFEDTVWGLQRYINTLHNIPNHINNIAYVICGHKTIHHPITSGNMLFIDTKHKSERFCFVEINNREGIKIHH
jgi:serine/threonine protein phosphatase 1